MDNYIFDLDESVTRTPVSYQNRYGIDIAADLYSAKDFDASAQNPALIIGAPYGGVKEQSPGLYAQILAQRGLAVLTFDPYLRGRLCGRHQAEGAADRARREPRRPVRQYRPNPVRQAHVVLHREPLSRPDGRVRHQHEENLT